MSAGNDVSLALLTHNFQPKPAPVSTPLPETPFYAAMASGHYDRASDTTTAVAL